jgi:microcystin-dependent protein
MSEPLLGEIKLFAGNFEPPGWLTCDGRLLAIREHTSLFEILGNSYGGDGRTTFGLPDLRGRVPMGVGAGPGLTNRTLGQKVGAESVVLDVTQLPAHDHTLRATNSSATQTQPAGNILATAGTPQYLNASTSVLMGSDSIGASGSNAPHANVQPSTVLRFLIAIAGKNPRDEVRVLRGVSD